MAKRTSSRQFVTVFVSLILSFGVKAADLTIGYQTGIDPSKVPQAILRQPQSQELAGQSLTSERSGTVSETTLHQFKK